MGWLPCRPIATRSMLLMDTQWTTFFPRDMECIEIHKCMEIHKCIEIHRCIEIHKCIDIHKCMDIHKCIEIQTSTVLPTQLLTIKILPMIDIMIDIITANL